MSDKPLVLILCTGNSCRSQMAEAFLKKAGEKSLEVASAGSKPSGFVHPLAIEAMHELGIDLMDARSKSLEEFLNREVETVITVCGNADQACPGFPGQVRRYHWGFDDPALAGGTKDEQLEIFRQVRDELQLVFTAYGCGRVDSATAGT